MSCKITEVDSGKIVEIEISGKLTSEAYGMFVPLMEQKIQQFGKVRMLVVLHDFHGWELSALWEDIKFDAKHFSDIERLALVGESKWEKGMSVFCKPFTTAKIKYFDQGELAEARQWIQSED
ncbi:SpoIIAA family protein [Thalassoroseus pseudoceratinae]|uniref:STAS/SEC14 domain-containing protein n=1 Tax=Thalassoroseus pseudoceratinae TaxID=2713176 RepID=UPI00141FF3FB|nr:STAS/SEC14 domain-containing protein [Thalassoroseus pseudoceratinae]